MSKTAVEILKDYLGDLLDPVSTGTLYGIVNAMEEYASLRSKELQERVEQLTSALDGMVKYWEWQIKDPHFHEYKIAKSALSGEATKEKDESLEAYNRECKRVDELTEELAKIRGSLIISNNSAKRRGEKIAELEGLLNNISAEIHDKPGLYHAWTLINKALGK